MIERKILRRENSKAILAGVVIAKQYVFAREALSLERNVNVFDEADDRRHWHGKARRMNPVRRMFFGVSDAFEYQNDGASSRTDIYRLE